MSDQSDRCPLCGEKGATTHHDDPLDEYCLNPDCNVRVRQWPRVLELVAIRDAAVKWHKYRCGHAINRLEELARQEADNALPKRDGPLGSVQPGD